MAIYDRWIENLRKTSRISFAQIFASHKLFELSFAHLVDALSGSTSARARPEQDSAARSERSTSS